MGNYCCPPSSAAAFSRRPAITTNHHGKNDGFLANHENDDAENDEDDQTLSKTVLAVKRPGGATGRLRDAGFEFRLVPCEDHASALKGGEGEEEEVESSPTGACCCCCCFKCTTRLFHLESGTMITSENRKAYIPDGSMFDVVSDACQEIAQDRIQREHSMKFITICNDPALGEPVQALVNNDFHQVPLDNNNNSNNGCHYHHHLLSVTSGTSTSTNNTPAPAALLIITGKGKSRAGIMSVKHVVESGIEIGSALYHLVEVKKRNPTTCMLGTTIMLLDPNARGVQNGMDTIDRSLTFLFSNWNKPEDGGERSSTTSSSSSSSPPSPPPPRRPLYILAHSAAGGFLTRYLLLGQARHELLENICALVFTDSTHRIQWARNDIRVFEFLQSYKCLYIRNNALGGNGSGSSNSNNNNNKAPLAGEKAMVDIWWRQRFGQLETVWGGTCDHSFLCWNARTAIWNFFDKHSHYK